MAFGGIKHPSMSLNSRTTDAAAQLVELSQAEAMGVFDDSLRFSTRVLAYLGIPGEDGQVSVCLHLVPVKLVFLETQPQLQSQHGGNRPTTV